MQRQLDLPQLSLAERDRRWTVVRAEMRRRNLDCLVLWGWATMWDFCVANSRYLCPVGGNAEFNVVIFPASGEPTCIIQLPTFLEGWRHAQNWVSDIRARQGSWARSVSARLKELGLQNGRIGMDGLPGPLDSEGWLPHGVYQQTLELLPSAEIVNLDDMMERIRAIKSAEEIKILEQAAALGDLMMQRCREVARPGVKECQVYGAMMETMLSNGGEEPTLFLFACGRYPYPHPFRLPTQRRIERGDLIICEIHPKYAGYFTHIERTFCVGGEPDRKQQEIYAGCLAAYERGLRLFGPGKKMSNAMEAVKHEILVRGLDICETGIHGHGLASLEYPRYRHHAIKADQDAIAVMNDQFEAGMVFAFNIDLFNPAWKNGETGCVFAETIAITENGARRMHDFPISFQIIS